MILMKSYTIKLIDWNLTEVDIMNQHKKEFKSLISEEQYKKIKNYYAWEKEFDQINYYYVDDNNYITDNQITVRVRKKSESCKLQVKIPESIVEVGILFDAYAVGTYSYFFHFKTSKNKNSDKAGMNLIRIIIYT